MVDKAPTARSLAREAVYGSILAAARARLTDEGPAQLSLRAVARDVGLVSSAVYRYFPSRDDLLTALLVLDYDELGTAVETAEAPVERSDHVGRWIAACRAVRRWAVDHPGDFALLYGSPVPGYAAPQDTVVPATRTTRVLVRVVTDAWAGVAGSDLPPDWRLGVGPAIGSRPGVAAAVADAVAYTRTHGLHDDPAAEVVLRTLIAWTTVFGTLSFELFGHAVGTVTDPVAYFDEVVVRLAHDLGLDRASGGGSGPQIGASG